MRVRYLPSNTCFFFFLFFFGGGGMKFVAQLKHNTKHNTLSIGKKNKEFKDL